MMNKYKNLKIEPPAISYIILFFFFVGGGNVYKRFKCQKYNVRLFIMSSDACCMLLVYSIDQPRSWDNSCRWWSTFLVQMDMDLKWIWKKNIFILKS